VYMSPEQLSQDNGNHGYLGSAVDVWASGVLLIVMLVRPALHPTHDILSPPFSIELALPVTVQRPVSWCAVGRRCAMMKASLTRIIRCWNACNTCTYCGACSAETGGAAAADAIRIHGDLGHKPRRGAGRRIPI
jgi:hypothetical protein